MHDGQRETFCEYESKKEKQKKKLAEEEHGNDTKPGNWKIIIQQHENDFFVQPFPLFGSVCGLISRFRKPTARLVTMATDSGNRQPRGGTRCDKGERRWFYPLTRCLSHSRRDGFFYSLLAREE